MASGSPRHLKAKERGYLEVPRPRRGSTPYYIETTGALGSKDGLVYIRTYLCIDLVLDVG